MARLHQSTPVFGDSEAVAPAGMAAPAAPDPWASEAARSWQALVDNTDDSIQVIDREGIIRYINRPHTRLEDVVGTSIYRWVVPEDREQIRATLERVFATGVPASWETHVEMAAFGHDQPARWFSVKAVPTTTAQGVSGAILIATDVSRTKQTEEELRRARDAAEAASRAKTAFVANMSHEVRTPLNAIIGFTELALEEAPNSPVTQHLQRVHTSSHALLAIINDLLTYSRIEAGRLTLKEVDFDLAALLDELRDTVAIDADRRGLSLTIERAAGTPRMLRGDPERLRQVLTNLLRNAIKFTSAGSVAVRADVLPGPPLQLTFSVVDTGIGVAEPDLARIFESFTQLDGSATRQYGGAGLGLAICQRLVTLMGGTLKVRSVPGQGSEFSFTVPLDLAEQMSHPEESPGVPPSAADQASPSADPQRLRGARLLLADDVAENLELALAMLRRAGAEVVTVTDGAAAVAAVKNGRFDLVLMDLEMPHLDGIEATRVIRADPRFADLPIIALTGHAMHGERCRSIEVGMTDHVAKPIDRRALIETVANHLGRLRRIGPGRRGRLTPIPAGAAPASPSSATDAPLEQLLARLERQLEIGDLDASDLALVVRDRLSGVVSADLLERLLDAVATLEFPSALVSLRSLRAHLPASTGDAK